jgi:signal transduction histidine kinase
VRRIRIAFGLLAALLFVPLGLLLQNALESVDAERADRHAAVAERVFDEMERELSRLVRREEERPFGHYDFYYVPDVVSSGRPAVARSPLSSLPEEPFVLGYFQIDPDGSLHSPLVPRESVVARALGDWAYSDEIDRAVRKVEAVAGALPPPRGGPALKKERAELAQAPGTTRVLERSAGAERREASAGEAGAERGGEARVDAFRAIRSLNRGAEARGARRSIRFQIVQEGGRPTLKLHTDLDSLPPGHLLLGPGLRAIEASLGPYAHPDAMIVSTYDVETALRGDPVERVAVAVFPLVGRVDREHLILFRDAYEGQRAYRQGLVLGFAELTRWLDQTVVGTSELTDHASRDFFLRTGRPAPRALPDDAYAYVHRFAEPFDDLALRMMLPPLPDVGGTSYLYTIAVLLVLAGVAGVVALYHMIAVAVRYADRRSNFAAAVSHELKTPLTAIRMHGEMLREGLVASEEKRQEYYETITTECERLTRLINNVLEFSRLEQGTREMSLTRGTLGPVVAEAARTLEPHAGNAGFRLEVEIDQDLPPVRFERDAVIQVVFNLVDNALKYAKGQAREPVITLQCVRRAEVVVLAVRDSGPGVAPRHLSRIFEPFYRGQDELTRSAQGTGIGLALVKGLAERMGASVTARNRDGGGFEVSLSFRPASAG